MTETLSDVNQAGCDLGGGLQLQSGRGSWIIDVMELSLHRSCLSRQLAEVEAIQAIYAGDGEFLATKEERAALELLRQVEEDENLPFPSFLHLSFAVQLLATKVGGRRVSVHFSFPRKYPELEVARVSLTCGSTISKHQHEIISGGAQTAANDILGNESTLQVLDKVQELALKLEETAYLPVDGHHIHADHSHRATRILVRKLVWFHHIKSIQKRKNILEWSHELRLGGYCKPGFPGVLIFEGEKDNGVEYLKRIQNMRWQALQIRGEEEENLPPRTEHFDTFRRFPLGIKELPESGMSDLAAKCREANLEQLFLTAMKLSR